VHLLRGGGHRHLHLLGRHLHLGGWPLHGGSHLGWGALDDRGRRGRERLGGRSVGSHGPGDVDREVRGGGAGGGGGVQFRRSGGEGCGPWEGAAFLVDVGLLPVDLGNLLVDGELLLLREGGGCDPSDGCGGPVPDDALPVPPLLLALLDLLGDSVGDLGGKWGAS
jgi:hypothetical protein